MSQPAIFRNSRAKGRYGQKLGLDFNHIELSNNHQQRQKDNLEMLHFLRQELILAEQQDRWSKARKLRRLINQELEVGLYLTHSWCGGCYNVLSLCTCEVH